MNIENIDELYSYAKRIAGCLGCDLVHHVLLEMPDKPIRNRTTYLKACIRYQYFNRESTFNKLYNPIGLDEISDIEDVHHQPDKYDSQLLHRILLEMEREGYGMEVQVYKDCTLVSSVVGFARNVNLNPRTITKITKFVHNEIIRRYTELEYN